MDEIGMPLNNKEVVEYKAPFEELYFMHEKNLGPRQAHG